VPTWNYAVVHAYGHLNVIEDTKWLMAHLKDLTGIHEADSPVPEGWTLRRITSDRW
jgi:transcriptional regulator